MSSQMQPPPEVSQIHKILLHTLRLPKIMMANIRLKFIT